MPTFPITRPPRSSTFDQSGPTRTIKRTEMEVGPPKVRRRSSLGLRRFTASYMLTAGQAAAFETWFAEQVGKGALSFDWPDPRLGANRTARFGDDPYRLTPLTYGRWELSVSLEVWD